MLDKIKALKEILLPDAIKLDIPIDEYIKEYHTKEEQLDVLLDNIFPKKPNNRTLSYCFDVKEFKNVARKKHGIKVNSHVIEKFNKKSKEHADQYNFNKKNQRHQRKLLFNRIGKGGCKLLAGGVGVHGAENIKRWLSKRPLLAAYYRIIENGGNVDNYLIVLNEWDDVNQLSSLFGNTDLSKNPYFEHSYSGQIMYFIQRLFLKSENYKQYIELPLWELNEPIKSFLKESGFKYRYNLPPIENIKDLEPYLSECVALFKEWDKICVFSSKTNKVRETRSTDNKHYTNGLLQLRVKIN